MVTYVVDPYNGYQAKVIYKGQATPYKYEPYTPYKPPLYKSVPASPIAADSENAKHISNPHVKELTPTTPSPTPYFQNVYASPTTSISLVQPAPVNYATTYTQPRYRYFGILYVYTVCYQKKGH